MKKPALIQSTNDTMDRVCRQCNTPHSSKELKRTLGEFSAPYSTGFCSAFCYTSYINSQKANIKPNKIRK